MQTEAVKADKKQIIASFPRRAAYSLQDFASLFGREKTWAYRLKYDGKIKVIPSSECRGGDLVPHSEVERLLSTATTYSDEIAGKAVPKRKVPTT
jgi:hypothetical protein